MNTGMTSGHPCGHQSYLFLSIFLYLDDKFSKYRYYWIFTKPGMCIDIVEIWFGIANGQISSIFDRGISLSHNGGGYYHFTFLFIYIFLLAFLLLLFFHFLS